MNAKRCNCGAVTVEVNGESYSMTLAEFRRRFPGTRLSQKHKDCHCNYCVNNWGVDLCGCGSGLKFGRCDNKLSECIRPAQSIEDGIKGCYTDGGGWGRSA